MASLYNVEAEQGLLGAILVNNMAYERVVDILTPDDFGNAVHGRIFAAIGKLVADGIPANSSMLKTVFDRDGALVDIGGTQYLSKLAISAVTVINAPYYAQQIADMARRRDIIVAVQDTIADAVVVDPARSSEIILDEAEERLFEISERRAVAAGPVALGTAVAAVIRTIEATYKAGGCITVNTGLVDVDRIVSGMSPGNLIVIGGRPGMGKTALAGSIAVNVAQQGKRVAIFSLEMTGAELTSRWLAGRTGISTDRQRHGQIDQADWPALVEASRYLSSLDIMVDDQSRLSVPQMRQRARRMRRRHGLDLIIVDHLQLVRQGGRPENRRLEIGDATGMLKALAKELKIPVVLLSQLSRGVEQRDNKRPILSDLRESGDIEQDADVVMFLYREEYYLSRSGPRRRANQTAESFAADLADWDVRLKEIENIAEIEIAKNRHGREGLARVAFFGERQRFENLTRHDQ